MISELHWLTTVLYCDWMVVSSENLDSFWLKFVSAWLGVNLEVITSNISVNCGSLSRDNTDINITSRTLIIVDTGFNGIDTYLFSFSFSHIFFVLSLHN